jgi:hypothetical protein
MAVNGIGVDTGGAADGANANLPLQIPMWWRRPQRQWRMSGALVLLPWRCAFAPMKVLLLTIQEDPPSLDMYNNRHDPGMWSEHGLESFRLMLRMCLQKDRIRQLTCQELLSHWHFVPWRMQMAGPSEGRGQGQSSVAWLLMWTNCLVESIVHCPPVTSRAARPLSRPRQRRTVRQAQAGYCLSPDLSHGVIVFEVEGGRTAQLL